ncbi:hypothetical protein ACFODO_05340 [Acinetobacter sichuanensis]|uniref:Uncharacterized protein n=1 Tax=Acinetobacter sichuanensis TaxID=2136183 RepID=A0ABV7BD20_9GAMM
MDIQNPEKIEIEGLKTIHKLCKFGANHNMEGCSFTEIVERMFDELSKAQAVPEGFVLVKKAHPDAIVHNQGLGLFKECQVIYGWDGKSKDFKDALNKGFYHGVKLGAKAVLETAIIKVQEQGHE